MLNKIFQGKEIIFLVFLGFFLSSVSIVQASNPTTPINPNDNILDPGDPDTAWGGCGPTDSNCYVTTTPTCISPQILVNNVCVDSTPPPPIPTLDTTPALTP